MKSDKDEAVFMGHELEKKNDVKPKRTACPVCFGMGVKERPNGTTFDCPNRVCDNGFIIGRVENGSSFERREDTDN